MNTSDAALGPVHRVLLGVCIAGLVWVSVLAVTWGLADMHGERAHQLIRKWEESGFVASEWAVAHAAMERALWLEEKHPVYQNRMGLLYQFATTSLATNRAERRAYRELAKQHFRRSIEGRRTWPLTHANLLKVKEGLNEFDREFIDSMRAAVTYGPWEPGVLRIVSRVGLSRWYKLGDDERLLVAECIIRGLTSRSRGIAPRVLADLRMYRAIVTDPLLARLEQVLTEENWHEHRAALFGELFLAFWDEWREEPRIRMLGNFTGESRENSRRGQLLNLARQYGKLPLICPRLPRDDLFTRYCVDRRLF